MLAIARLSLALSRHMTALSRLSRAERALYEARQAERLAMNERENARRHLDEALTELKGVIAGAERELKRPLSEADLDVLK